MKKLLFILICGLIALPVTEVIGAGTDAGTTIINRAKVEGANFTAASNTVNTNVQRIVGGIWDSFTSDNSSANAGVTYTNVSFLSNFGNDTIDFQLEVNDCKTNGEVAGYWQWRIYANAGGVDYSGGWQTATAGPFGNITLNEGASTEIWFVVTVAGAAGTAWQEWQLSATTPNSHVNTNRYLGDQGTWFGGPANTGWGQAPAGETRINDALLMTGTGVLDGSWDSYYRISTSAPVIGIQKTIVGVSDPSGGGNIAIPGATITYQIYVTNSGSGNANNVVVKDFIDTANLQNVSLLSLTANVGENSWAFGQTASELTATNTSAGGAIEGGNSATFQFTAVIR